MDISPPWLQLPEVALDCVFSHLENPGDLLNAMRTCSQWERVLKPRKPAILLANAFPFISKYVDLDLPNELLSYRTLCKDLKIGVDNCVEYSDKTQGTCSSQPRNSINNTLFSTFYDFEATVQIVDFMRQMESHQGNPFIGRCIKISFSERTIPGHPSLYHEMQKSAEDLLTRFGKELKEITFSLQANNTTLETITQFQTLLSLVPNLQCLEINWKGGVVCDSGDRSGLPRPEEIASTFPVLESLRCLHLAISNDPVSILFGSVLIYLYGPQLNKLITDGETLSHMSFGILDRLYPNLRIAQIKFPDRAFCRLRYVTWTLECLQIGHHTKDFVGVLNSFRNTLVHLDIDAQLNWGGFDRGPGWHEPLPELKMLKTMFENTGRTWFREMIPVKFPNLTVLEFKIQWGCRVGLGMYQMKRMGVEERRELMRSNVLVGENGNWFELLPQLEKIKIVIDPTFDPYRIGSVVVHRQ